MIKIDKKSEASPITQPIWLFHRLIALVVLIVAAASTALAVDYPANPNIDRRDNYVADPAGVLSAEETATINSCLEHLRQATTVEMAVAVLPTLDGEEVEPYSVELFERWGLGNADNDNGGLIVVDIEGRQAWITTGYGLEGVLTDAECSRLFRNYLAPGMKAGRPGQAILATVIEACTLLEDPYMGVGLRSDNARNLSGRNQVEPLDKGLLMNLVYIVAAVAFFFALVLFIRDLNAVRKRENYDKANLWRSHLSTFWICSAFSLGTAVPFALLALFLYRRVRNKRIKCQTCGAKMVKLNEEEDNNFLNPSQDFEENLGTVDYDVWHCPKCGTVERFPFLARQLRYTECPECHTVAMCLKCDRIITPATTRSEGYGVKEYECLFCHHKENRPYKIPRKEDNTAAALAAGAIIGSAMGRGRGGGGGFGGGFGGGHTGGGGAGGHW